MKSKLKVVKIGGKLVNDRLVLDEVLKAFADIEGPKVLVHGGGNMATTLSKQLGVKTEMIDGRRITNKENLDVVTMVYAGLINKQIVAALQKYGCNAIGLAGCDANSICAHKRPVHTIDYGLVGDIDEVNTKFLKQLFDQGICPVFSAIGHNGKGQLLNTNADTVACQLAIALSEVFEVELLYCFEKQGVLSDPRDDDSVISSINQTTFTTYKNSGVISEGLIPKLSNCFNALEQGVENVIVGNHHMLNGNSKTRTQIKL